jgi:hypothetical protein
LRSPECCCSTTIQCDSRARQNVPLRRRISPHQDRSRVTIADLRRSRRSA